MYISLWWFWKALTNSWWKELVNWRYTALHHAVSVNSLQMVKLLVELGADITITDWKGISDSKFPVQRAVGNGSEDIVHYFVRECGQQISTLSKRDQHSILTMVEEYERTKPPIDTSVGPDEKSPVTLINCSTALQKIQSLYCDLSNLRIEFILPNLVSEKVVTLDEELIIREKRQHTASRVPP